MRRTAWQPRIAPTVTPREVPRSTSTSPRPSTPQGRSPRSRRCRWRPRTMATSGDQGLHRCLQPSGVARAQRRPRLQTPLLQLHRAGDAHDDRALAARNRRATAEERAQSSSFRLRRSESQALHGRAHEDGRARFSGARPRKAAGPRWRSRQRSRDIVQGSDDRSGAGFRATSIRAIRFSSTRTSTR